MNLIYTHSYSYQKSGKKILFSKFNNIMVEDLFCFDKYSQRACRRKNSNALRFGCSSKLSI